MRRTDSILAWHQHPEPAGTAYFERHLQDPDAVAELFGHTKVLRAMITRSGWRHLWERFGLDGLVEINRRAGWFNPSDPRGVAEALLQQSLIAGFNPASRLETIEAL
jgi:hypothetical protein